MINILTPEQLSNIPNNIVELYSELENFIILDFSRRLKKVGQITSSAEWISQRASLFGIKNVEQEVAKILNLSLKQVEKMFPDLAEISVDQENKVYSKAGLSTATIKGNRELEEYIEAAIIQTKGELKNITNSLGIASNVKGKVQYSNLTDFYRDEMNLAHIKISSGVQDYNSAIKDSIKKLSQSGIRYINYESNYSNNLDVAVRRAVLTSSNQMSQTITDYNMKIIIPNEEERFCEVSAHAGARTGVGIANHQAWQGRVYKIVGSTKDYPNLKEKTGLGDSLGLLGINCKHSYMPFIPGASERTYTDKELENIDPPPFSYKGKEYTYYEATQYQRKIESNIRNLKREALGYKETGLEDELKATNSKINILRSEYKQFSKVAEISEKKYRLTI